MQVNRFGGMVVLGRQAWGNRALPSYRLYRLDGAGKITTAEWIDATDDEHAARQARETSANGTCEVWDRSRLVARIGTEAR
jgi:hypothetical protein